MMPTVGAWTGRQSTTSIDVLVIGGGNAALCAALMAREAGASVLLLEASPREWRGGNSQHTRNLRCMHDAPQDVLVEAYPEEEYWQDLLKVTGGMHQRAAGAARRSARRRPAVPGWRSTACASSRRCPARCTSARTNAFFMGGGKALVNAYYRSAEKLGVAGALRRAGRPTRAARRALRGRLQRRPSASRRRPACSPPAASSRTANGCARPGGRTSAASGRPTTSSSAARASTPGVLLRYHDRRRRRHHRRPDAGAHGRDRRARAALRRRHLHAHRLRLARRRGQPRRASASTTRARTSGPSATRSGAAWSRSSPGRSPTRSSTRRRSGRFMPPVFPGTQADTLARAGHARSGSTEAAFVADRRRLQRGVPRRARSTTPSLDDCHTEGLSPAKTHWARPIDTPPFYGYRASARHHLHLSRR